MDMFFLFATKLSKNLSNTLAFLGMSGLTIVDLSVPVRHSEAEYLIPIRAGDKFKAILQLNKLGTSSLGFEVWLVNSEGATCTKVRSVHVFINRMSGKKTNIPGSYEDRLRRYLSN